LKGYVRNDAYVSHREWNLNSLSQKGRREEEKEPLIRFSVYSWLFVVDQSPPPFPLNFRLEI